MKGQPIFPFPTELLVLSTWIEPQALGTKGPVGMNLFPSEANLEYAFSRT
jgi:hypothetical protein